MLSIHFADLAIHSIPLPIPPPHSPPHHLRTLLDPKRSIASWRWRWRTGSHRAFSARQGRVDRRVMDLERRWVWPSCWLQRLVRCSWWSCHEQHMGWNGMTIPWGSHTERLCHVNPYENGLIMDWWPSRKNWAIYSTDHGTHHLIPNPWDFTSRDYWPDSKDFGGGDLSTWVLHTAILGELQIPRKPSWQCTIITKCVASIFDHQEKDDFPARWDYRRAYQCCWLYHTHLLVGSHNCPVCLEELLLKARSETIKHQKGQDESIAPTWA